MESHGHTILIVDDDRELPLFLEYALTNNGFNVITAGMERLRLNTSGIWLLILLSSTSICRIWMGKQRPNMV